MDDWYPWRHGTCVLPGGVTSLHKFGRKKKVRVRASYLQHRYRPDLKAKDNYWPVVPIRSRWQYIDNRYCFNVILSRGWTQHTPWGYGSHHCLLLMILCLITTLRDGKKLLVPPPGCGRTLLIRRSHRSPRMTTTTTLTTTNLCQDREREYRIPQCCWWSTKNQ